MKILLSVFAAMACAISAFGQASVTRNGLIVQQASLQFTTPFSNTLTALTATDLTLSAGATGDRFIYAVPTGAGSFYVVMPASGTGNNSGAVFRRSGGNALGLFIETNDAAPQVRLDASSSSGTPTLAIRTAGVERALFNAAGITSAAGIFGTTGTFTGAVTGASFTATGSDAGRLNLPEGPATALIANTFSIYAPTDVAAGGLAYVVPAAAATGLMLATNSSGVMTITHSAVGAGVVTALGVNTGTAGAIVVNGGALGTPSSGNASALTVFPKADVLTASLFAADAGSTDDYAITLSPAITAYVTGAHYWFKANTANTGAATININAVGAKTIVKVAGGITTALATNDIRAGQWVDVVYDGTNMQIQSTLGNAPAGAATLTSTQVGYGDGSNVLTGEAAFNYTAASNTMVVGAVSLGAGAEASTIGPLVDSVDGTTPLNNINQVVAAGTAYTMTASYASLDFGTTDPVLTIANAGTYAIYADVQFNLVGATYATYDSVTIKLRRTNNTAADLTGSTFGTFIPTITTITATGPYLHVGPIKYTTSGTTDTITVQAILGSTPSVGSVTASACTITAIRAY